MNLFRRGLPFKYVDRKLVLITLVALIVEIWALVSNFHFLWKPLSNRQNLVQVALVESLQQTAKTKGKFQLNWRNIVTGMELYEGDELMTGPESSLTIQFVDGRTVRLGADSVIILRKTRLLNTRAFTLTLLQGSMRQESGETSGQNGQLEVQVGNQKVVSSGSASFTIENRLNNKPSIEVAQGNVEITDSIAKQLRLGNADRGPSGHLLNSFRMTIPSHLEPANAQIIKRSGGDQTPVVLNWTSEDQSESQFVVEIAKDPDFSHIIVKKIKNQGEITDFEFKPNASGTFYWRVVEILANQSLVSNTATFTIQHLLDIPVLMRPKVNRENSTIPHTIDAPILKRPIIHYPEQGASLRLLKRIALKLDDLLFSSSIAGEPQLHEKYSVELEWQPVLGAKTYVVQIAADPEFKQSTVEIVANEPKYTWQTNSPGFYYWRVAAQDSDGDRSPFSEFMTFTIQIERNMTGKEESYETYLAFDEYSKHLNLMRIYYGAEYLNYNFTANASGSPSKINLNTYTYLQLMGDYSYWLNPYYSLYVQLNLNANYMDPSEFTGPAPPGIVIAHETQAFMGAERRIFTPTVYFTIRAGLELSLLGRPFDVATHQIGISDFAFFGPQVTGGVFKKFFDAYTAGFSLGALFQTSGLSIRAAQIAQIEIKRPIYGDINLGFSVQEIWDEQSWGETELKGFSHSLTFYPLAFVEFTF